MKHLKAAFLAVVGTLALTAGASAAVVCNDDGDCWRSKEKLDYPPEARLHVYGDDYAIGPKYKIARSSRRARLLSWRSLDRLLISASLFRRSGFRTRNPGAASFPNPHGACSNFRMVFRRYSSASGCGVRCERQSRKPYSVGHRYSAMPAMKDRPTLEEPVELDPTELLGLSKWRRFQPDPDSQRSTAEQD